MSGCLVMLGSIWFMEAQSHDLPPAHSLSWSHDSKQQLHSLEISSGHVNFPDSAGQPHLSFEHLIPSPKCYGVTESQLPTHGCNVLTCLPFYAFPTLNAAELCSPLGSVLIYSDPWSTAVNKKRSSPSRSLQSIRET